jgi:peptidyl-prolyl cis-trans isomerase C
MPTPVPRPVVAPTTVAATVNGQPIYEQAVQRGLERVPPAKRPEVRSAVINLLVDNLLIEQHLKQLGVAVPTAEVDKRLADLKKAGKEFEKMLEAFKISESELREHIAAELRWYKYAGGQASDKVLQELFNTNKDMFDGTTVRARHILISPKTSEARAHALAQAQLLEVKKQIDARVSAGLAKLPATTDKLAREKAHNNLLLEAFSAAAKEKSECPTKAHGGDLGWFQKLGLMVAPFAQAAFALQPYQMSGIVKTPFGYHLILVTDRKPGRDVKFSDVKEAVKDVYFDRLHDQLAAQVRARSKVVVNPPPK